MRTGLKAEVLVGLFMVIGLLAMFFLAMKVSNLGTMNSGESYRVKAHFDNIGSLKTKAPVTMAGVEVGRVAKIDLDKQRFQAVVGLDIYKTYDQIPEDAYAKILTAGLLGEQYIGLDPGGSDEVLKANSEIEITQSALVLEDVIGQFIFGKAKEEDK